MSRASAGTAVAEAVPGQYERLIVLANPRSTQGEWARAYLGGLDDSDYVGDRRVELATDRKPENTKDKLANAVQTGDAVIVAGGDKTVGDAAEVVMGLDIPLLPVWAGNANDIAHMLNGKPGERGLLDILASGNVVQLFPIQRESTQLDGTTRLQTASNYVGFGISGLISDGVNDETYRAHPKFRSSAGFRARHENIIGVRAALARPHFDLAWTWETPDKFGDTEQLFDLTVANGHRMGKRDHVLPVGLADRRLFVGTIDPGWRHAAAGIGRMALHRPRGQYLEQGEVLAFRLLSEAWAHADGDADRARVMSLERIWQSEIPYLAISTMLAPGETAA